MHRSHTPLPYVAVPVLALVASGCSQTPAAIEIDAAAPKTIETMDAIPLPKVVVKDDSGEPLEEQPAIDWSTKPEGVVQIAGGTLSPIKSGTTTLIARVKDTAVQLQHPLKVQLVDRITITCEPDSCRFAPGDRFRLRAQAKSGDGVVEGVSFEWSSDSSAIVEALGGGEFQAKGKGITKVQAAARGVIAHQSITVESPVDKLIVICPNPPAAVVAPAPPDTSVASCVVKAGETLALATEVRSGDEVIERRPAWTSTNPTYVEVSGGRVTGANEGAAMVEARVENLLVTMPVEVRRSASDRCEGDFGERFQTTLDEEPALFACSKPDSVRCFERAVEKGSKKKPMTAVATLAAAKKCCCVQIPTLASAAKEPEAKEPEVKEASAAGDASRDDAKGDGAR